MPIVLSVESSTAASGEVVVRLGHELLDDYLRFLAGRSRPNSVLAAAFDLKVFFSWAQKEPGAVTHARDVINFVAAQRAPRATAKVVRISDGGSGLSARTVARRLSSISGLFAYLVVRGDAGVSASPVPRGLITRRDRRNGERAAPLVRRPVLLPRILEPAEVDALIGALRTRRDRAMVEAMVLGGLRRCKVLGLRVGDLRVAERKVFIADGKGGRQRVVPVSSRFFASVAAYLDTERPAGAPTDFVFVVLKGPHRGQPLSAYGLDEIIELARDRAGLAKGTCHELRHTWFTRSQMRMPGITTKELMSRIGHSSPRLRYQHATGERDRAITAYLKDTINAEIVRESAPIRALKSP